MQVELKVNSGPCKGKVYSFDEPQGFTFGRAEDCTCRVEEDMTFSRHHFLLEVNPPQVWLRDLGSLNGTYVNDKKVGGRPEGVAAEEAEPGETVALRDGDQITAGRYDMQIKIEVPAICVDCGLAIPTEQRQAAEFVGGSYLCLKCREAAKEKEAGDSRSARGLASPGEQIDKIRLSENQRIRAEENPGAIIDELFKFFMLRQGKKDGSPEILGYRITNKLGEGGFGAVYAAIRLADNQLVALKTLLQTRKPEKNTLLMFEREKEITSGLNHPNVIKCKAAGCWNDIHFIELEYMDGGCVGGLLERKGKLTLDEAIPIMLQTLEALAYVHHTELELSFKHGKKKVRGIVHRDLKPQNILLSGSPGRWTARLSDFGLSKAFSEAGNTKGSVTIGGMMMGTLPYIAPEHLLNYRYLKPSTDVFEMAATFYNILTGSFVWDFKRGVNHHLVILQQKPKPIREKESSMPPKVAAVIDKALALEPVVRYQDGREFLEAFRKAL